jgi:hypothetical protein
MATASLSPAYDFARRFGAFDQRLKAMETKVPFLQIDNTFSNQYGFSLPALAGGSSWANAVSLAPCSLTVPQGYTQAYVTATGAILASVQPATLTSDLLQARLQLSTPGFSTAFTNGLFRYGTASGSGSNALPVPWIDMSFNFSIIWSGLTSGAVITAVVQAQTGAAWSAATNNTAGIELNAIFMP